MNAPASFQGFHEPPAQSDPNADNWRDRIVALGTRYPEQWAKYGPYASKKSASHAAISARDAISGEENIVGESTFEPEVESGRYFVYVKAWAVGARASNVSPIFREAQ